MITLVLVICLAICAVIILLIPALFGKVEPTSPAISDSDDIRLNGADLGDRAKAERLMDIEFEVKHNPEPNAGFIKKSIWIAAILAAAFVVYYIASPYQNCLAKSDKNWCAKYTNW